MRQPRTSLNSKYRFGFEPEPGDDEESSWMTTYSDITTLLLTFLILIIAVSEVDQNIWDLLKQGLRSDISRTQIMRTPLAEIKQDLEGMLAEEIEQGELLITLDRNGLLLEFTSASFFETGSADLMPYGRQIIQRVKQAMDNLAFYEFNVDVEGHTDDLPIQTLQYPSNWELSVARATGIVRSAIGEGFTADRLKASGFADTRPVVPNRDSLGVPIPENQARNRRILIRIYYP